jgi:hypothetical protein
MKMREWLKPGLIGAVIGAIALAVVGFSWGGWVTGIKADSMASDRAHSEVVDALLPFCIAQSRSDPDSGLILAKLKETSAYMRADVLMQAGWATAPGETEGNRALARACAASLEKEL